MTHMETKTLTFHVSGTHCASCKILIEDTLNEQGGILNAKVDLANETVSLETTRNETAEALAETLTATIRPDGYTLSVEKIAQTEKDDTVIWQAIPIGLAFLALFFIVQKSGILNFGLGGTVTPLTSFLVGLIASVSSCLAVVGGLVLSLSATVAQDDVSDRRPMMLFHGGRLVAFALLGGVLGSVGATIGMNLTATMILGIIASIVMILLGLHLVGVFKKNLITLPPNVFRFFQKIEHKTIAPFVLGAGTFFLPCGFTQAMQIVALSSGSFVSGLLIMGAFALGTLPMLALLSFGSASFARSKHAALFFRSAGVVVIGLGVFALLAGLAGLGIIAPLFSI